MSKPTSSFRSPKGHPSWLPSPPASPIGALRELVCTETARSQPVSHSHEPYSNASKHEIDPNRGCRETRLFFLFPDVFGSCVYWQLVLVIAHSSASSIAVPFPIIGRYWPARKHYDISDSAGSLLSRHSACSRLGFSCRLQLSILPVAGYNICYWNAHAHSQ